MTSGPDLPALDSVVMEAGSREDMDAHQFEQARGSRRQTERIAIEDMTLVAGIPTEEVMLSLDQGWAVSESVAEACRAYEVRKHAPSLMASDDLPHE